MGKGNLIYREITEQKDLEQAFRLRYTVYKEAELGKFLSENESQIDISIYDLHAIHVGLFLEEELIASHRLCVDRELLFNKNVLELGKRFNVFSTINNASDMANIDYPAFPFISYTELPVAITELYTHSKATKTPITEVGKFAILPTYRGIRNMKLMFDCMIAIGMLWYGDKKGVGITTTDANHPTLFLINGFTRVAELNIEELRSVTLSLSLSANLNQSSIPTKLHDYFNTLADELKTTGKIEIGV